MVNNKLNEAIAFASEKHINQIRKDGSPYIFHPLEILMAVKEAGYPTEYQIVAVLHDTYEDTSTTIDDLMHFGKNIAEAVLLLSKNYDFSTKEQYIERILKNHIACVVKNYDRICNLREAQRLGNVDFLKRYVENSKKYYYKNFSEELDDEIFRAESAIYAGWSETQKIRKKHILYVDRKRW